MKKHIISSGLLKNSIIQLLIILNCIGCVSEYKAKGIDEITDILVVEGIITDDESIIKLSQSKNITDEDNAPISISDAIVYVECDDGTKTQPGLYEPSDVWPRIGRYTIKTGKLNPERKYRLKIEFDRHEYRSDFSYPINTPEIDSVFWRKSGKGQPVNIYVATHSAEDEVLFYRWSYREDWEIWPEYYPAPGFPQQCWSSANSRDILIGSAEKTEFGQLTDKIFEALPSDKRWSVLYRIAVKQNAISKRAHDYFTNIKKNSQNMGSIFAPTPSELRGNIICTTDPKRPVIGYIDISSTTQKTKYISRFDYLYERNNLDCSVYTAQQLIEKYGTIPIAYVKIGPDDYILLVCVLCEGTAPKPDDWPDNY